MVGGEWKYIQWNKYRRNIKKKKRIRRDECNEVGKNEAAQKKKKDFRIETCCFRDVVNILDHAKMCDGYEIMTLIWSTMSCRYMMWAWN